ncbi:MAG: hypothetical protein KAW03_09650, partial [Candidatus Lokiarchaeota archaeon]|nr:hypothetical protein [Candidatus Lokiarchaeota archaeon]
FIFLLTISVTIVSILGGLSAILILSDQNNLGVDPDAAEFNLDINNVTLAIDNIDFTLPFNLTNAGYFDMENLELSIQIALNYSHVDDPVPGVNTTRQIQIFTKLHNFGTIAKGTTGFFNFTGVFSDFNVGAFPNFTTQVDWLRGPPAIELYANLTISLDYSIGLHSLTIGILNLFVTGFDSSELFS